MKVFAYISPYWLFKGEYLKEIKIGELRIEAAIHYCKTSFLRFNSSADGTLRKLLINAAVISIIRYTFISVMVLFSTFFISI